MKYAVFCLLIILITSCKAFQFKDVNGQVIDPTSVRDYYKKELRLIDVKEGETLVDIGCGNWVVDATYATLANRVHFVLLDTNKQFTQKVNVKARFYSIQRTYKNHNNFKISTYVNTPTSLPLQSDMYKKVLARQSFHEWDYKTEMLNEIKRILHSNGELIIIETKPNKENEIDKGCGKPHYTAQQIIDIVTPLGFTLQVQEELRGKLMEDFTMNLLVFRKK